VFSRPSVGRRVNPSRVTIPKSHPLWVVLHENSLLASGSWRSTPLSA